MDSHDGVITHLESDLLWIGGKKKKKKLVPNPRCFEKYYADHNANIWGCYGPSTLAFLVSPKWWEWGAWPTAAQDLPGVYGGELRGRGSRVLRHVIFPRANLHRSSFQSYPNALPFPPSLFPFTKGFSKFILTFCSLSLVGFFESACPPHISHGLHFYESKNKCIFGQLLRNIFRHIGLYFCLLQSIIWSRFSCMQSS